MNGTVRSRRAIRALVVVPAALAALALGGCHGGRTAPPPVAPTTADPLAGVDSTLDALEREIDADARDDPGR
jgi:hypothetical protein